MSQDVECPYCEEWLEVCHDDGFGYEEDVMHEMECHHCGKKFTFQTHISFDYYSEKADCLNGGEHDFTDWRRLWTDEETGEETGEEVMNRNCRTCEEKERKSFKKESA